MLVVLVTGPAVMSTLFAMVPHPPERQRMPYPSALLPADEARTAVTPVMLQADCEEQEMPVQIPPLSQPRTLPAVMLGEQAAPVDSTPKRDPRLPKPPVM